MLIKLQADVNDLKVGLAQAESALKGVDDSVKTASTGMTNFVSKMKQVGATMGVAFAGTQVVQFGKDVIMAASNMNESLGKMQVVFGENATAVEKWANTSSTAMGMSKQSAVEAAGTYGNLFQAFGLGQEPATKMSTTLVQLASDMASFNNTSIDDAILALRSGLSGETEPLKKFGVALSEARLKEEAMSMGLIKSTKEALTPAAKAQASYALIMKDTILAQGDFARTGDGTANTMRTLQANMENAKASLGAGLLPVFNALLAVLKPIIASLASFGNFLAANKEAVTVFIGVLAAGTVAWGAYTLAVNASTIATKAWAIATKANPIGLLITAVALLAAGMVTLWNKSDTFRKMIIEVGKAGVTAMGFIIKITGELVTGMMKLITGPMRLLLKGLSMLGNKSAGDALKEINGIIDNTGKFFDNAAKKVDGLKGKLDELGKQKPAVEKANTAAKDKANQVTDKVKDKGKLTDAEKSKLEKYQKDVLKIYKDMNDAIADSQEKAQKELEERNDKMIEAQKNYDETMLEAHKTYRETLEDAQKNYDDREADLRYRFNDVKEKAETRYREADLEAHALYNERTKEIEENYKERKEELQKKHLETLDKAQKAYNEKDEDLRAKFEDVKAQAQKRYDKAILDATERKQKAEVTADKRFKDTKLQTEKDYAKKVFDLNANLEKKLADLRENAAKKSTDLTKTATEKQLSIVQQSIDRLRNAFSSKTGFDLGAAFGEEGASASTLLEGLKKSLTAAKTLQANAGVLAGMGYSQVFIEEVVKQGPEAGNKIAEALKSASPAATAELQSLYGQINTVSTTGLDALAASMNQGGRLATKELTDAYYAVSADLALALSDVQKELQTNLAEVNAVYEVAVAEAKATRDEKLADAAAALKEALATAKTAYDASVADATETLNESLATAKKNLTDGMAEALKTLNEAKVAAKKDLDDGLAEAEKAYTEANAKAKKALDDALAAAKKALTDAMAEAQKDLDKGLADAVKALEEAREKAKKALDERLADAQKVLQDALIKAQKDYETAIDAIAKATDDKLASLKTKLAEVASQIAALGAAQAAANALANAPVVAPVIPGAVVGGGNALALLKANEAGTKITINTTNLTDPASVAAAVSSEIKFGAVVTATRAVTVSNGGLKID
jgi:hypothetical protein